MKLSLLIATFATILLGEALLSLYSAENNAVACRLRQKSCPSEEIKPDDEESPFRMIAIGDIHGSYDGLLEDLFDANITKSMNDCQWKDQALYTILVQNGDLVDRGPGALESLHCLQYLQETAPLHNAEVHRILGSKFIVMTLYFSW